MIMTLIIRTPQKGATDFWKPPHGLVSKLPCALRSVGKPSRAANMARIVWLQLRKVSCNRNGRVPLKLGCSRAYSHPGVDSTWCL